MSRRALVMAASLVAGLATALPAAAQFQKPEDAVKYRKAAFTVMATHFGRIGAMAQGRVPFDGAAAASNAEVAAFASHLPYAGFVEGTSSSDKGGAKPAIWSERAKFDAAAKKMQDEMAKLVTAAKSNSLDQVKTQFQATAGTCKSCHDDFRNP